MKKENKRRIMLILKVLLILFIVILLIDNTTTILKKVYPIKYKEYVLKYARANNIDPLLVFAVIKAESGFDKDAVSSKKAMGLMQITEGTAVWGATELGITNFSTDNLFDSETNIRIGCWYLGRLMIEFNNELDLVIAAYNGGSGNVKKWLGDSTLSSSPNKLDKIPFGETEKYLKKVRNYYYIYIKLYENTI